MAPLLQFTKIMQVSKVLAYRLNKETGLDEYKIRWKGYHKGHNSWEPFHDLRTKEVQAEALQVKRRKLAKARPPVRAASVAARAHASMMISSTPGGRTGTPSPAREGRPSAGGRSLSSSPGPKRLKNLETTDKDIWKKSLKIEKLLNFFFIKFQNIFKSKKRIFSSSAEDDDEEHARGHGSQSKGHL
jgi:hypothetical protein